MTGVKLADSNTVVAAQIRGSFGSGTGPAASLGAVLSLRSLESVGMVLA